jgi:hypothetical protein
LKCALVANANAKTSRPRERAKAFCVAVKKFEPSGEVIGAGQFETRTAGRQIDNVTFNRRRLRAKKDFPDPGDQTPWGHAKPASFVRPVHLSAELESLHLYVPLITDPLRRGAYYLTEIMEHSSQSSSICSFGLLSRLNRTD